jgi:hypothetical protein
VEKYRPTYTLYTFLIYRAIETAAACSGDERPGLRLGGMANSYGTVFDEEAGGPPEVRLQLMHTPHSASPPPPRHAAIHQSPPPACTMAYGLPAMPHPHLARHPNRPPPHC